MKEKILLTLLLFSANNAFACSCVNNSVDKLYSMATSVFTAYIIKAELKSGSGGLYNAGDTHVEGYYQVDEIFKGKPNDSKPLLDADLQSGNCSIGLTIGMKYIFFLDKKSGISHCSGTRTLGFDSNKDTELLDILRKLKVNAK